MSLSLAILGVGFISAPQNVHGAITREASASLGLSKKALDIVVDANFRQDKDQVSLDLTPGKNWFVPNKRYQPAHHFDRNEGEDHQLAFERGVAYVVEQESLAISHIRAAKNAEGLKALGRACHATQDLYAHSNYIDLEPSLQADIDGALAGSGLGWPPKLMITGYAKATGNRIPGDKYSHEDFCKDGVVNLGVKKIVQGESAKPHGSGPCAPTKFQVARGAALRATKALFARVKAGAGRAWSQLR